MAVEFTDGDITKSGWEYPSPLSQDTITRQPLFWRHRQRGMCCGLLAMDGYGSANRREVHGSELALGVASRGHELRDRIRGAHPGSAHRTLLASAVWLLFLPNAHICSRTSSTCTTSTMPTPGLIAGGLGVLAATVACCLHLGRDNARRSTLRVAIARRVGGSTVRLTSSAGCTSAASCVGTAG